MRNQILEDLTIIFAIVGSLAGICVQPLWANESSTTAKPIIAINTDLEGDKPENSSVEIHYIDAIRKAGGIPVLLPPMPADDLACVLSHVDGVMMIGGADYPPALYHQQTQPSVSLMKKSRSDFDMALLKAVLADKTLPFLGICAGCQALNIGSGGSLIQDIPLQKPESKIKHSSPSGWTTGFNKHTVEISKGSKLSNVLGQTELTVVTSHHQCVAEPGKSLTVIARSPDGLPEALEKEGECFVMGVQWHPERDFDTNHKLFEELVRQAAQRHNAISVQAAAKSGDK